MYTSVYYVFRIYSVYIRIYSVYPYIFRIYVYSVYCILHMYFRTLLYIFVVLVVTLLPTGEIKIIYIYIYIYVLKTFEMQN